MIIDLHKITRIVREDGVMSFQVLGKKYSAEIDYSLLPWEQISEMLWREVYYELNGGLYITNN